MSRWLRAMVTALASIAVLVASVVASIVTTTAFAASPAETAMAREKRTALVIGNGRYASSPLANPVNDARAMSAALRSMGFRVILVEDASIGQMADAVRKFGETLQPGGVGLFFYAGHGMQIKGRNYLIPVGADIQREDEVAFNAYDAGQVLEKMEASKSRVNIVILDACRNNPFTRSFRSSAQGLASIDAPVGAYVAMATAPGRVAGDGSEGNGVYTKHLLAAMKTPGIPIEDVFKRTRVRVMAATENQQVPWDYSSLSGNFYFVPTDAVAAAEAATASAAASGAASASASGGVGPAGASTALKATTPVTRLASAQTSMQAGTQSAAPFPSPPAQPSRKERDAGGAAGKADAAIGRADSATTKADAGQSAAATYDLALQYKIGRKPIQQDLPRALKLFVEAGQKGHAGAQAEAARAYANGVGTAKSCRDAIAWAQKAAKSGSLEGAVLAGDLNRSDCDGARNLAESVRWYRVAADKGTPSAQFALGLLYLNGEGVAKDVGEARKWLTAAAGQGNQPAKFYLERLPPR